MHGLRRLIVASCIGLGAWISPVNAAADLLPALSFGYEMPLSRDLVLRSWSAMGDGGHVPPVLSDRIILTPPHPGNRRGWLWTQTANTDTDWQVDFEFRSNGPDRGDGSLNIWYAKDGPGAIGSSHLYSVGKFTGMVVSVDQYKGLGGTVRVFLNDGTKDFKQVDSVDDHALAMCMFPYRDTGFFIPMTLRNTDKGLELFVNGQPCAHAEKVRLPPGYHFGVSAASATEPDSFEVAKFVTYRLPATSSQPVNQQQQAQGNINQQQQQQAQGQAHQARAEGWAEAQDSPASTFVDEEARFKDLHDRLTVVNRQLNALTRAVNDLFSAVGPHINAGSENAQKLLHRTTTLEQQLKSLLEHTNQFSHQYTQTQQASAADLKQHNLAIVSNQLNDLYSRLHASVQQAHSASIVALKSDLADLRKKIPPNTFWHFVYAGLCQGFGLLVIVVVVAVGYSKLVKKSNNRSRKFI